MSGVRRVVVVDCNFGLGVGMVVVVGLLLWALSKSRQPRPVCFGDVVGYREMALGVVAVDGRAGPCPRDNGTYWG